MARPLRRWGADRYKSSGTKAPQVSKDGCADNFRDGIEQSNRHVERIPGLPKDNISSSISSGVWGIACKKP